MSNAEDAEDYEGQTLEVLHRDGRTLTIQSYVTVDGEVIDLADCVDHWVEPTEEELQDPGRTMMKLFVKELIGRLKNDPRSMKSSDFEVVRKLASDNSITFAQVRAGDFGSIAQRAAEEFAMPFPVAQH